eukprot:5678620-Alexandrium_andersonii.AAC.1
MDARNEYQASSLDKLLQLALLQASSDTGQQTCLQTGPQRRLNHLIGCQPAPWAPDSKWSQAPSQKLYFRAFCA